MRKCGDRVTTNGCGGIISQHRYIFRHDGTSGDEYKIRFDQPGLIGTDEWYREEDLSPLSSPDGCPICGTPWKITKSPILCEDWVDCPTCNKTKEEIEKQVKQKADIEDLWKAI